MMRTVTIVMLMLPAIVVPARVGAQAGTDSARAVLAARAAAGEAMVNGYFLGAAVAGPFAIAGAYAAATGSITENRRYLAYPLPLVAITVAAGRGLALPPALEASLAGESEVYAATFRRTYEGHLGKRRRQAIVLGVLAGTMLSLVLAAATIPAT